MLSNLFVKYDSLFLLKEAVHKCSTEQPFWKVLLKYRKVTVMKFFFNKVASCDLTKKGFRHSFFRLNFVKFLRSAFLKNIFGRAILFL